MNKVEKLMVNEEKFKLVENCFDVIKFVDDLLSNAIKNKVSDIHFEPYENEVRIRFRIDGILKFIIRISKPNYNNVANRIRVMMGIDICDSKLPLTGRTTIKSDKIIDLRVSTMPTYFGDKIVIRILDKTAFSFEKKSLGFLANQSKIIDVMLSKTSGIIFVTGSTGSGKTTSLYSFLNELNSEKVNIVSIEDPIEYMIDGITQTQVNEKTGYTFESALKSILRQDPNIIMIGEIRDKQTAELAVRYALTGHLVLTTLHTNDAIGTIGRLIDFGIEPYLLADSLIGIISQKLIKKLCPFCREEVESFYVKTNELNFESNHKVYNDKGCEKCNNLGYNGRVGVFEVLLIDEEIKKSIYDFKCLDEIRSLAQKKGMESMKDQAKQHLLNGSISFNDYNKI